MLPGEEKPGLDHAVQRRQPHGRLRLLEDAVERCRHRFEACSGVDGGSAACSALDGALKLEVKEGSTVLYDALAKDYDPATFNLAPSASRTLDFRFYLPLATGNAYQGGSYSASYTWDAGQPTPPVVP